jgi:hypothetical protein
MTLKSNYHLELGQKQNEPTENTMDLTLYASGTDGSCLLTRIITLVFAPRLTWGSKTTLPPPCSQIEEPTT